MKPWRRKPEDRLDPAERAHVLARDPLCIIERLVREGRITGADPCAGPETYEHVKPHARMGKRATSVAGEGRRWAVRACLHHNDDGATSKYRPEIREWLAELAAKGGI